MLGTNPIAFGAPGVEGDDFVLDMATTAVAVGKVLLNNYIVGLQFDLHNSY